MKNLRTPLSLAAVFLMPACSCILPHPPASSYILLHFPLLPFVPTDWDFRSMSPGDQGRENLVMKLAVCFVCAALAYFFIVGIALVWIRGASRIPMPKPPYK